MNKSFIIVSLASDYYSKLEAIIVLLSMFQTLLENSDLSLVARYPDT